MLPAVVRQLSRGLHRTTAVALSTSVPVKQAGEEKKKKDPTILKLDEEKRTKLANFGRYVAECLPKFVQQVQFAAGDELELLIHPSGVVPVMSFPERKPLRHSSQTSRLCAALMFQPGKIVLRLFTLCFPFVLWHVAVCEPTPMR
ncbi:hypothetical protein COOONC_05886 [Cooperia oncophora]